MDAALYDLAPPKVTALYGLKVPKGPIQTVRYDDGTGDELAVTLGTTAFVSGKTTFEILPKELKSVAIRARARYAPHPFQWMRNARAFPTGLGLETEALETPLQELPEWDEQKVKTYPFVSPYHRHQFHFFESKHPQLWKNVVTGLLYLQVHPCATREIEIDPLPAGKAEEGALYPKGAHLTDLEEIRDLLYKMQRPGIAPNVCLESPSDFL